MTDKREPKTTPTAPPRPTDKRDPGTIPTQKVVGADPGSIGTERIDFGEGRKPVTIVSSEANKKT